MFGPFTECDLTIVIMAKTVIIDDIRGDYLIKLFGPGLKQLPETSVIDLQQRLIEANLITVGYNRDGPGVEF